MDGDSHYEILGVERSASKSEIKHAYRRMVKQFHPDINPSVLAKDKIRHVNEAYEVLAEHYSRRMYDMTLDGDFTKDEVPKETQEEKYRREYLRKKAREERINIENLLKVKIKFYRFQRIVCYLFFASGILFTIDYYHAPYSENASVIKMKVAYSKTELVFRGGTIISARELFDEYKDTDGDEVIVTFSSIFKIPTTVALIGSDQHHPVLETLHMFKNILSIITFIFSALVISRREYSDFNLTCGIIPSFLVVFMFLMASSGG